jgi:hypothetical protein
VTDLDLILTAAVAQLDEPIKVPAGALAEGYDIKIKTSADGNFTVHAVVADDDFDD